MVRFLLIHALFALAIPSAAFAQLGHIDTGSGANRSALKRVEADEVHKTQRVEPLPKNSYWKAPQLNKDEWLGSNALVIKMAIYKNTKAWAETIGSCIRQVNDNHFLHEEEDARKLYCPAPRSNVPTAPWTDVEIRCRQTGICDGVPGAAAMNLVDREHRVQQWGRYSKYVGEAIKVGVHVDQIDQYAQRQMYLEDLASDLKVEANLQTICLSEWGTQSRFKKSCNALLAKQRKAASAKIHNVDEMPATGPTKVQKVD